MNASTRLGLLLAASLVLVSPTANTKSLQDTSHGVPVRQAAFLDSSRTLPADVLDSVYGVTGLASDSLYGRGRTRGKGFVEAAQRSPAAFSLIGKAALASAEDIAVSGTTLFVAAVRWIKAYDISDPGHIRLVSRLDLPEIPDSLRAYGSHAFVAIKGNFLYCLNQSQGLFVIDISDPASLHISGYVPLDGILYLLAVHGDYAYTILWRHYSSVPGLQVLDIANPSAPTVRGFCEAPMETGLESSDVLGARNLEVWDFWTGSTLAAFSYSDDYGSKPAPTVIIDVSSPDAPAVRNFRMPDADRPGFSGALAGEPYYLWSLGHLGMLRLVDMASYNPPKPVCSLQTPSGGSYIVKAGDTVFSTSGHGRGFGLDLVDVSVPYSPRLLAQYRDTDMVARTKGLEPFRTVRSSDMFVSNIIDNGTVYLNRPAASGIFEVVNRIGAPYCNRVVLDGNYLYSFWCDLWRGVIATVNLLDTTQYLPSLFPANYAGKIMDVAASDGYVYISEGVQAGIEIIDVRDRWHPKSILPITPFPYLTEGGPNDILVSGNYLYLAGGGAGLLIYDITQRDKPVLESRVQLRGECGELAISGDYVYVANFGEVGVCLVDVHDKTQPVWLKTFAQPMSRFPVVKDTLLFLTVYPLGHANTEVWSIADPANPQYLAAYGESAPGAGTSCRFVYGHYMYSTYDLGIDVADISNPESPQSVGQIITYGVTNDIAVRDDKIYMADAYCVRIAKGADCCTAAAGDLNMSGFTDASDLAMLVGHLTGAGTVVGCSRAGDVNSSGLTDATDLARLLSYLTGGGAQLQSCH